MKWLCFVFQFVWFSLREVLLFKTYALRKYIDILDKHILVFLSVSQMMVQDLEEKSFSALSLPSF